MNKCTIKYSVLAGLLSLSFVSFSQHISGTVTDHEGNPLPGVNIVEEGTANGTVTDVEGKYSIEVKEGGVLIFSYVGFASERVEVGGRSNIDVVIDTPLDGSPIRLRMWCCITHERDGSHCDTDKEKLKEEYRCESFYRTN